MSRFLAGQFARPSGLIGRWFIGRWLNRISRPMNALALQQLKVGRKHWVLEVGFGGGDLIHSLLAATTGEVFGADISRAMVNRARRRFRRDMKRGRLRLWTAPVDALPLPTGSIDRACSVNNIYFWPDPVAAVAELARVVRPGGRLVICFEPSEELRKWPGHRFGFRLFDGDEVSQLVRDGGFGEVQVKEGKGHKPDRFLCLSATRLGGDQ